ncbi:hypothetical protein JHK82_027833 [Glycine max]|nr:hypothetical protein JHK82_027833 [Glycine max]
MAAANAPIAMREALTVWSMDGLSDNMTMPINLKAKVVVAAHDKDINSVAVAPNDSLVCSGSQDHTTCVWRLPNLVSVVVFKGHKRGIWSVEFSPVDQCVVTASGDKTIRIWAISDGSCLKTFKGHTSSVLRALFVTRGTQIVSCGMRLSVADFFLYNILVVEKARIRRIIEAEGNHTLTYVVMPLLEEGVVKGQELENVVSDADYTKAIQIAFELRRPHRLFELFVKQGLGGRVHLILSEVAPLSAHVEGYLQVVTCALVLQGYGNEKFDIWVFVPSLVGSKFKVFQFIRESLKKLEGWKKNIISQAETRESSICLYGQLLEFYTMNIS